jgi:hypothetical protein
VVFGQRLWSSAEREAAPVPLPCMLSRAHQVLSEAKAAFLWEERTKTTSRQFTSVWSHLEQDRKEYKKDL